MTQKVLLAASNPFMGSFLKKCLEMEGYSTVEALSGDELMDCLEGEHFDLVITQVGVGGVSGMDVCRRIKVDVENSRLPVLLLSSSDADEQAAKDAGADAFVKMPFSEEVFCEIVHGLLIKKKRILLVDDSKVIHSRTGAFLESSGFDVLHAYDGLEGVEAARLYKPNLIITDIEMPNMDGFDLCAEIKNDDDTALIPVIIVSSLDSGINIDRGFSSGANDYLVKPVVHEELLSCVNGLLKTMEVRRQETILLVEKNKITSNMIRFGLLRQGFRVLAASENEDAFYLAINRLPDVVIIDIDTPDSEGSRLVKYLKDRPDTSAIPVILIASREAKGGIARGLGISASAFISKPFTTDKVLMTVERITTERRLAKERETMHLYLSEAAIEAMEHSGPAGDDAPGFRATEKNLTMLFSDIVGFTSICERLKPLEVVTVLNNYLDAITTALKENGAIIDKFIGDAVLAVFGHRHDMEPPQYRAAKAALDMMKYQELLNEKSEVKTKTRIGINSGRVIFGDIGSRFYRRDFTVIGDHVNIAQRLQAAAPPDTILISEFVYDLISDRIKAEQTGQLDLKGKSQKIRTYRLDDLL